MSLDNMLMSGRQKDGRLIRFFSSSYFIGFL